MTTLCNTVNYRSIILNSRYQYIAMPVPVILQDHYDKQWILEHVNGNKNEAIEYESSYSIYMYRQVQPIFFKGFFESCEKYLLKDIAQLEYYVFTDDMSLSDEANVHLIKSAQAFRQTLFSASICSYK